MKVVTFTNKRRLCLAAVAVNYLTSYVHVSSGTGSCDLSLSLPISLRRSLQHGLAAWRCGVRKSGGCLLMTTTVMVKTKQKDKSNNNGAQACMRAGGIWEKGDKEKAWRWRKRKYNNDAACCTAARALARTAKMLDGYRGGSLTLLLTLPALSIVTAAFQELLWAFWLLTRIITFCWQRRALSKLLSVNLFSRHACIEYLRSFHFSGSCDENKTADKNEGGRTDNNEAGQGSPSSLMLPFPPSPGAFCGWAGEGGQDLPPISSLFLPRLRFPSVS